MTATLARRAGTASAGALAVALSLAGPASAAADPQVVDDGAGWLTTRLADGYRVDGEFGPSYGQGADVALALLAAGGHDGTLGTLLTWLEQNAADYTQGTSAIEFGEKEGAAYVGATAKLALTVEVTGGDATNVSGIDLVAQLLRLKQEDGRFADDSAFGSYANLYGHSFAVLALDAGGQAVPQDVVQALLDAQCADGSFPETYPTPETPCTGQVDATGLALQALAAVDLGASADAAEAVAWLQDQQGADGAFPGEAPVNSTGYAVLGLDAVGAADGGAVAWLAGLQNADGGLPKGPAEPASDLFATAQALPALAGETFLSAARPVARLALPEPTPEPTTEPTSGPTTEPTAEPTSEPTAEPTTEPTEEPTSEPTADPTATAAPGSDPTTEPTMSAPTTTSPAPSPTTSATAAGAPASTGGTQGQLPRTGTDAGGLAAGGAALVAVGLGLALAARTRRSEPR